MKPLCVCLFTGNMDNGGGTERMTQMVANGLAESGICVHVLSKTGKGKPFFPLNDAVHFSVLPKGRKQRKPFSIVHDILALFRFVKNNGIDVLINVDVGISLFSLPLIVLRPRLKQVFWEHFCVLYTNGNPRMDSLRKYALKHGDAYVTLTQDDANELLNKYDVSALLRCIPNICTYEISENEYDVNSRNIITAGHFLRGKGFDLAIQAANHVAEKHPEWKWLFYGDGPCSDLLKKQVDELNLDHHVIFMGRTAHLSEAYEDAAIYVLPSRSEGFGLVLAEAKAYHLPCVAFDVPYGPRNLIEDGTNGFLVPSEDVESLAACICKLIEDTSLRKSFSEKSHMGLERLQKDTVIAQWKGLLEEIVCPN